MNFYSQIFCSIILIITVGTYAQSIDNIDPSLLAEFNNNFPGNSIKNSNDLSKFIQKMDDDKKNAKSDIESNYNKAFEQKESSIDNAKESSSDISSYEKLINGEIIYPDKMIPSLSIFGHDIFKNSKPSTFAPSNDALVQPDYNINTGDEINIMLWGRINEEYTLKVQKNGNINIPRIGPVSVSGLKFETMQKNISDRISKMEGVNVNVSMGEMRTIGVYIIGEVKAPGFYTISALSNITNALFSAGGPTKKGSLRNIQLKRNGNLISKVDFYDFLLSGNDNSRLRLQSGDVIFVPIVKKMAAIAGNVRRSAIYEITNEANLQSIISLAGGITPAAWTNKIQISRFKDNEYHIILDIDSISQNIPDYRINDGDLIKIFPVIEKDINAVYLTGNVTRPGPHEFKEGMRIHDLIPDYQNLLPESYFEYAVVYREEPPSFLNRIIAFNLRDVIENVDSEDNIYLKPKDQIMVYNRDFFEPERNVSIDGSVTKTGTFKLMDNMKIRDLILQAGGLNEEASLIRGEIYRRHSIDNEKIKTEKIDFCVSCAMKNDPEHNLSLYKSDAVYIRSKMGWESQKKVTLKGQFTYPGVYVLFEGETLGELIERAGGFKSDAYLSAAIFSRQSILKFEKERIEDYNENLEEEILKFSVEKAAKEDTDVNSILAQKMFLKDGNNSSKTTGRVVIDLTNAENYADFALEDGDQLLVPRNLNTVSVIGEVFNPTTFKYQPGQQSVSKYIESAGGLKENADKKHIYVIKANGSIVTKKDIQINNYQLSPGDAVVVPQKIDYVNANKRFIETADAFAKIAGAFGTILTLIVAVAALK